MIIFYMFKTYFYYLAFTFAKFCTDIIEILLRYNI